MPVETGALTAGIEALARATELPFPEFTAKLVMSTFDAIVAATIHQMEAYADLVTNIAKTIKEFELSNVTDADVTKFLIDCYSDGRGGTTVRTDYVFTDGPTLGKVFYDLVDVKLKNVWTQDGERPRPTDPAGYDLENPEPWAHVNVTQFVDTNQNPQIGRIRLGIRRFLAEAKFDQLRVMAREGMARVVVSDGHILSKLTFHVATTDEQAVSHSEYTKQQIGAVAFGGLWAPWGAIAAAARYSSLNIKTQNDRTFNKATMDAQIIGEVKLSFQTQTFPSIAITAGGA